MHNHVFVSKLNQYNEKEIEYYLPDTVFEIIKPGNTVILKPNWVSESHQYRKSDWEYIITHPSLITAVLKKVIKYLEHRGKIIILDGPETVSSFEKIISHYPIDVWRNITKESGIEFEVIDLRDDEWISDGEVIIERKKLVGDPKGKTVVNLLDDNSEFHGHKKSQFGYYGADYDIEETNKAHDGINNKYSVSRSVIKGDVFINLPKLKTHKKAGITCCLKNLVGINTYKNYLPHHSIGKQSEGGDQFLDDKLKNKIETKLLYTIKKYLAKNPNFAGFFSPLKKTGKRVFGDTNEIVRSGNWYGNDTIWRMILDLNKVLFYAEPEGSMREEKWDNAKRYIGIVDGILGGEGNGPKSPDPVKLGYIICGTNPVAIDSVAARLIGFDPLKIPSILNAFNIIKYPICDFQFSDITVEINNQVFSLSDLPQNYIIPFKPHFGWKNHIEYRE